MIRTIEIPTNNIEDWGSLHTILKEALGFPDFYGRNGNAFIHCLTYDDDFMSVVPPRPGGMLALKLLDAVISLLAARSSSKL